MDTTKTVGPVERQTHRHNKRAQASGNIQGPASKQIASRRHVKTSAVIKVDKPEMLRSVPTRHHRTLRTSASRRLRAVGLGSAAWRRASAITIAYVSARSRRRAFSIVVRHRAPLLRGYHPAPQLAATGTDFRPSTGSRAHGPASVTRLKRSELICHWTMRRQAGSSEAS